MAVSITPVVLSWSGGKDSTLALERLRADPGVEVVGLLTTVSAVYDRVSIHGVRRSILCQQVAALDYPLFEVHLGAPSSNAEYESAFATTLVQLQADYPLLSTIAFGDLFLEDVRRYRESLLARLGWKGVYPLWGEPTHQLARYFISRGYRAVLTCVDTTQLDARFAGMEFDAQFLSSLPSEVDPCGERGEFHTWVYAGPLFRQSLAVSIGERVLRDDRFEFCDLVDLSTDLPRSEAVAQP